MNTQDIIKKSFAGESLSQPELVHLLNMPPDSMDTYSVMAAASRISKELSHGQAEIHAQFALNLALCPCNCLFCSFAHVNGIFKEEIVLLPEQAVAYARQFEEKGANAIFVMTTAKYGFDHFIEMSLEIRRNLRPETTLIANVGDQSPENAKKLKDAGYAGVYHALRLREGSDTGISPQKRKDSIRAFQEVGLKVGTCVEPVGPEHTNEELAQMIHYTASFNPAYSGAARRISIPGTKIAERGMINELRMAQIVAVTRLGMPRTVTGNCTHEPCTLGAVAGANLFWAELGANPRDVKARTEDGRGDTIEHCSALFKESGWDIWNGPSRYYEQGPVSISPKSDIFPG
ncbi:MAG: radical SAM protein [Pseudomonadota bacterium]